MCTKLFLTIFLKNLDYEERIRYQMRFLFSYHKAIAFVFLLLRLFTNY